MTQDTPIPLVAELTDEQALALHLAQEALAGLSPAEQATLQALLAQPLDNLTPAQALGELLGAGGLPQQRGGDTPPFPFAPPTLSQAATLDGWLAGLPDDLAPDEALARALVAVRALTGDRAAPQATQAASPKAHQLLGVLRERFEQYLARHTRWLGPLSAYLDDPQVNNLIFEATGAAMWVERADGTTRQDGPVLDAPWVHFLVRLLQWRRGIRPTGIDRPLTGSSGKLRYSVAGPRFTSKELLFYVRRHPEVPWTLDTLAAQGMFQPQVRTLLETLVQVEANVLVVGGSGSGKTSLVNALLSHLRALRPTERNVVIEEAHELVGLPLWQYMELDPNDPTVTLSHLLRVSLQVGPRRIMVGEVKGVEAADLLQAMNVGHVGCMATIHAQSVGDAAARLRDCAMLAGMPATIVREQIQRANLVVVYVARLEDGQRATRVVNQVALLGKFTEQGDTVSLVTLIEPDAAGQPQRSREPISRDHTPWFFQALERHGLLGQAEVRALLPARKG